MQRYKILWADDEIEFLKPHILFLEKKGYDVTAVNSGADALEEAGNEHFDVVFLDEMMPGMTGLETLHQIKNIRPNLPVVMITKSEEEDVMEQAIGSKIADYLIKPVNPNQILMAVKKITDNKRLVSEKTNQNYQQEFRNISMAFMDDMNHEEWAEIYKKLTYWELEIESSDDSSMSEVLEMQKSDANNKFARFVIDNYEDWLNDPESDRPVLAHNLMKQKVFPVMENGKPTFMLLIDNLRWDQWSILEPLFSQYFKIDQRETFYSILPTTTAYARNAIFSGLMPLEMSKRYPHLWVGDESDEGKNNHEHEFLEEQLKRMRLDYKWSYHKIKQLNQGKQLAESIHNLMNNDLNVIVYNFVDLLSHARTEMEVIRELAPNESAYRSLTRSWFEHSPLFDIVQRLANKDVNVVVTTDHGTMRVKRPYKIIGDRNTNTNLRYKAGKNLSFNEGDVLVSRNPEDLHLPKQNVSTAYVFAVEDSFFAYPNNYNYYVKYYKDTFQHGGISMEEMICPFVSMVPK
ncbi:MULTISPECIES: response regulator [Persicobacter]|uniref:Two-component system response regulator n=1 Tax=Persicobacter diffluens TaxID=981 RepID=A0AAN4VZJ6_9BACT|nr:response regulator [Persicobacter sp. CCB-QB2]GJM61592.1 two-component system response regulator [Persicobacter diffluens]